MVDLTAASLNINLQAFHKNDDCKPRSLRKNNSVSSNRITNVAIFVFIELNIRFRLEITVAFYYCMF